KKSTYALYESLRNGARFDSVAPLYSLHPSAAKGGGIGWRRIGSLNPETWKPLQHAKPGDVFGPYANAEAHEIYKVEAIEEASDADLRETMLHDRKAELESRYRVGLLRKYRFQMNPEEVSSVIFAAATEKADSILISLDAQGRRPKEGVRPGLGVIARMDGDSITFRDIGSRSLLPREPDGKAHIDDSRALLMLCAEAVLPRLMARDAIQGFRKREGARTTSIWSRSYGELSVSDSEEDPVAIAARSLRPNQISPVIPSPNGYALAMGIGPEAARAYTFEEVASRAAMDAREDAENHWVTTQLQRLRAATPARTVPARLEAVRLGMNSDRGGTRR